MGRDKVDYEWCIESQDEFGDVESLNHADTLAEALVIQKQEAPDWHKVEIALTRIEGNEFEGINWRGYAYLRDDGTLEPRFSSFHDGGPANDGPDVPQRFHKEVAASRPFVPEAQAA